MKRGILFLFGIILLILSLDLVSANFVCGKLNSEGISPSWFDVEIYYSENTSAIGSCKVSPQEGKYCCDPFEIEEVNWKVGKEINAHIYDDGYVAGPVSLTISGEGFDVFPDMNLDKVIEFNSPNQSIFVNVSEINFNISSSESYNNLRYELYNTNGIYKGEVCQGCNEALFNVSNLTKGTNVISIVATNGNGQFLTENKTFFVLDYIDFSREISCERCVRNFVYSGEDVNVNVILKTSHNVSGFLIDYFPADWTFNNSFDENLEIGSYSESHNMIKWYMQGSNIQKNYVLTSPDIIFTRKYYLQSSFENYFSEENELILYRFYRFLSIPKKLLLREIKVNYEINVSQIGPSTPLVMDFEDNDIVQLAIYPNKELEDVKASIFKNSFFRYRGADSNFMIYSSIPDYYIDNLLIKYKVSKPSREGYGIINSSLYFYDISAEKWISYPVEQITENENYVYFASEVDNKGGFAIVSEIGRVNE